MGTPIERGYDYNIEKAQAWVESPERKLLQKGSVTDEFVCEDN